MKIPESKRQVLLWIASAAVGFACALGVSFGVFWTSALYFAWLYSHDGQIALGAIYFAAVSFPFAWVIATIGASLKMNLDCWKAKPSTRSSHD